MAYLQISESATITSGNATMRRCREWCVLAIAETCPGTVVADRLFSITLIGNAVGIRVIGESEWTHLELVHPTIIASRPPPLALPLRLRAHHRLLIRHSGGRTRVFEHGITLERVGAIRVADVHHNRRNEEAKGKLEREVEKTTFLWKPG